MKKVLVVSSSPRRGGNSDWLCDEFLRGAADEGHSVEKVFLKDKNIGYCTGCGYCNTKHVCVQKDDMAELLDKMCAADVIALATPVYFYSMCGQLKTFIDRTVPRYGEITDKDFYFILTAADGSRQMLQRTVEGLRGFTEDCLDGARERKIIYGTGAWNIGEIKNTAAAKEAYEAGRNV